MLSIGNRNIIAGLNGIAKGAILCFSLFFAVCIPLCAGAAKKDHRAGKEQKKNDPYQEYISRYADIAVSHQIKYGIPASITLAQGLLESAAGRSTLASRGNNHFGIKCHNNWDGETMLRDDDAPNECFRVYSSADESFDDHSRFLQGKRYSRLFGYDVTDYSSWAKGLRECGYATDPNYASRLIAIIERYALYAYDTSDVRLAEENAAFILSQLKSTHKVRKSRGLHYVIASPGDTYTAIAGEFGLKGKDLAAFNDMDNPDSEIKAWEEVYLEQKKENIADAPKRVTIGEDESMHSISQRFGIRLDALKKLNPKAKDRPGTRLILQNRK